MQKRPEMAQIQKYKFKENSGLGKFCLKLRKEGHIISILGHVNMVASKNENRISKTLLLPLWKPVKNVSFATSKLKKLINWTKTFLIEIILWKKKTCSKCRQKVYWNGINCVDSTAETGSAAKWKIPTTELLLFTFCVFKEFSKKMNIRLLWRSTAVTDVLLSFGNKLRQWRINCLIWKNVDQSVTIYGEGKVPKSSPTIQQKKNNTIDHPIAQFVPIC